MQVDPRGGRRRVLRDSGHRRQNKEDCQNQSLYQSSFGAPYRSPSSCAASAPGPRAVLLHHEMRLALTGGPSDAGPGSLGCLFSPLESAVTHRA